MIEIARLVPLHADPLHHAPGGRVRRDREGDDLLKPEGFETESKPGSGRLAGIAMSPGIASEPPPEFHAKGNACRGRFSPTKPMNLPVALIAAGWKQNPSSWLRWRAVSTIASLSARSSTDGK